MYQWAVMTHTFFNQVLAKFFGALQDMIFTSDRKMRRVARMFYSKHLDYILLLNETAGRRVLTTTAVGKSNRYVSLLTHNVSNIRITKIH